MTTPAIPFADPLPFPAPPGLVWLLLQVTFFIHIVAMNVVLGGALLAVVARAEAGRAGAGAQSPPQTFLRLFAKALPVAIATTVTFGVAPLLFVQALYGRLFFTSSVLMGWLWLSVVPILITAYYGAYLLAFRGEAKGRWATWVAAGIALALLVVAFLYTSNMTLALRPEVFVSRYRADARGLHLNLDDPTFWPRYLHMVLGATAVAAMALAVVGHLRRARTPEFAAWARRRGLLVFGGATTVNLAVGFWFLLAQPRPVLLRLIGGNAWAATLLWTGVVLGIVLLAATPFDDYGKRRPRLVPLLAGGLAFELIAMLLVRDQVRRGALEAASFIAPAWTAPQWGPIGLFVVLLVAAFATVAWMVVALARGRGATAA